MANKKKKQRCYLYLRVSTEMQVEGFSLNAQHDRLVREANHREMQIVEEFRDEGKSGKNTTGRPQFTEMMNRIQDGNPDGVAPFGYKIVKDANGRNARLAIDEEEAEIVRLVFEKYAHTDMGYSGIAKWLNKNGYRREPRSVGRHRVFTDFFIKSMLDNPVYTGKVVYGRFGTEKIPGTRNEFRSVKHEKFEAYDGMHEAIISDELWQEVRAKRQATAGTPLGHYGPKNVHVLSGIVRCPVCGSPMYGIVNRKKKKDGSGFYSEIYYYICKNTKTATGKSCTYTHSVRQDVLDEQVIKVVQQAVNNMKFLQDLEANLGSPDDLHELAEDLDKLQAERKKEAQKKSRLLGKIAGLDADDDQYDAMYDDLQGILRGINQSISVLDEQIEEAAARFHNAKSGAVSAEQMLHSFRFVTNHIAVWPADQQRMFMHKILESVEIYPKPLPGGFLVKSIEFKFPVSVDGGLSFGEIVDMDYDDDDDSPPDDDPPSGGGGSPSPKDSPSGGDVSHGDNSTPNPNSIPLVSVQRNDIPDASAYSILGYKKNAVFPAPLAAVTIAWISSVSTSAVTLFFGPSQPKIKPCFFGKFLPCRHSTGRNGTRV